MLTPSYIKSYLIVFDYLSQDILFYDKSALYPVPVLQLFPRKIESDSESSIEIVLRDDPTMIFGGFEEREVVYCPQETWTKFLMFLLGSSLPRFFSARKCLLKSRVTRTITMEPTGKQVVCPIIAYITCPSEQVAENLARALLNRHAVACVNIIPAVTSL